MKLLSVSGLGLSTEMGFESGKAKAHLPLRKNWSFIHDGEVAALSC